MPKASVPKSRTAGTPAPKSQAAAPRARGGDQKRREMGMPVTATQSSRTPRAVSRALVSSAATQYKSTPGSTQSAWAWKSVTQALTVNGARASRRRR